MSNFRDRFPKKPGRGDDVRRHLGGGEGNGGRGGPARELDLGAIELDVRLVPTLQAVCARSGLNVSEVINYALNLLFGMSHALNIVRPVADAVLPAGGARPTAAPPPSEPAAPADPHGDEEGEDHEAFLARLRNDAKSDWL